MVPIPVVRFGFPTYSVVAPLFLPLAPLLTRRIGFRLGLKLRFPHRARMTDPTPLPHYRLGAEQSRDDADAIEPLRVQGGNPLFEIETRHRSLLLT